MVAIAESTPGPVAVNSATYIGYRVGGAAGSALSTVAVTLPSFVIIYVISLFLDDFLSLEWVGYAFSGIQVCVVYLILSAGLRMVKDIGKRPLAVFIFLSVLILSVLFYFFSVSFSSVFFILISGLLYLAASAFEKGGKK